MVCRGFSLSAMAGLMRMNGTLRNTYARYIHAIHSAWHRSPCAPRWPRTTSVRWGRDGRNGDVFRRVPPRVNDILSWPHGWPWDLQMRQKQKQERGSRIPPFYAECEANRPHGCVATSNTEQWRRVLVSSRYLPHPAKRLQRPSLCLTTPTARARRRAQCQRHQPSVPSPIRLRPNSVRQTSGPAGHTSEPPLRARTTPWTQPAAPGIRGILVAASV